MLVSVHISTNISKIRRQPGEFIYVIEGKGDAVNTVTGTGYENSTTRNRLELAALSEALSRIKDGTEVTVFLSNTYIRTPIELGWIYKWSETWNTRNGPVKNADLWQKVLVQLMTHTLIWSDETDSYAEWMQAELKRNRKQIELEHWKGGAGYE